MLRIEQSILTQVATIWNMSGRRLPNRTWPMAVVLQKSLSHAAGSGMAHIGGKSSAQFSKSPADLPSASGIDGYNPMPDVYGRKYVCKRNRCVCHGSPHHAGTYRSFRRGHALQFVKAYIMEQQKNSKMMDPLSNLSKTYQEYASGGIKTAFVNLLYSQTSRLLECRKQVPWQQCAQCDGTWVASNYGWTKSSVRLRCATWASPTE